MRAGRFLQGLVAAAAAACGAALAAASQGSNVPRRVPLTLTNTVCPSALHDLSGGDVLIAGRVDAGASTVAGGDPPRVRVRVTDDRGRSSVAEVRPREGRFSRRWPTDFPGAGPLRPGFLFVDATLEQDFDVRTADHFQAEAVVLVHDGRNGRRPEFPSVFTNDLLDAAGRTDERCTEWPVIRALVNLYMRSRAARLCGVGRSRFDLARPADLRWFKNNLTLYEFDHRDRDWSVPLGHRLRRCFWQAVWNTWFNASNNHPRDGNPANRDPSNFVPYAFTNDFCDTLMLYLMRLDLPEVLDDNLAQMCREGLENFMALQHRGDDNFALTDAVGRSHVYTRGAFRYGMFEDGEFLTEGKGWFHDPRHHDYIDGGVFNGRALWCIGEAIKRYPSGPLTAGLRETMAAGLQFCLRDALAHGYARKTPSGRVYWYDPGETGYLLLGMLAACETAPDLPVPFGPPGNLVPLRDVAFQTLDAMVELMEPHGQWQPYGDKDPMVIAALADGVRVFPDHPRADHWRRAALTAADSWLAAAPDPAEYPAPTPHFASRRLTPQRMTFLWDWTETDPGRTYIVFYISGHWVHALAKTYRMSGNEKYRRRAEEIVGYLCGANPWHVRLLNETGGIYNYVTDTDRDGLEDRLTQDMYPESTSFCQIGVQHLLEAIQHHRAGRPSGLPATAAAPAHP